MIVNYETDYKELKNNLIKYYSLDENKVVSYTDLRRIKSNNYDLLVFFKESNLEEKQQILNDIYNIEIIKKETKEELIAFLINSIYIDTKKEFDFLIKDIKPLIKESNINKLIIKSKEENDKSELKNSIIEIIITFIYVILSTILILHILKNSLNDLTTYFYYLILFANSLLSIKFLKVFFKDLKK